MIKPMEWKKHYRKTWKVISIILYSIMCFLWILIFVLFIIRLNLFINGIIKSNLGVIIINLIGLIIILIPLINVTIFLFITPIKTFIDRKFTEDFILYRGKKYYLENNSLFLSPKIRITSIEEIERLEQFTDCLENLNLSNNKLTKIEGLEKFTKLKSLELSYNLIERIEGLNNLDKLEELDLSSNSIKEISGLEKLEELTVLTLRKNYIRKIERLENCSLLEVLDLNYNCITELNDLKNLMNLRYLNVSHNKIEKVSGLETLLSLEIFNIRRNPLLKDFLIPKYKTSQNWVKYCQLKEGPKIIQELQNLPNKLFENKKLIKRIDWLDKRFNNAKFLEKKIKKRTDPSIKMKINSFLLFLRNQMRKDLKKPPLQILLVIVIFLIIFPWLLYIITIIQNVTTGVEPSMQNIQIFQTYSICLIIFILCILIIYYLRFKTGYRKEKLTGSM